MADDHMTFGRRYEFVCVLDFGNCVLKLSQRTLNTAVGKAH